MTSKLHILFTTQPALGHFHPLVPLAHALAEAGHMIAFASAPGFSQEITAAGFRHFPAGPDWREDSTFRDYMGLTLPELAIMPNGPRRRDYINGNFFAGVASARMLPDILALQSQWPADVIVRERFEYAGCLAAERIGIRHATVQVGSLYSNEDLGPLRESLNRLRTTLSLPPDPDLEMLYRYLMLSTVPAHLQTPGAIVPETLKAVHFPSYAGQGEINLPDEWKNHQRSAWPLIYVTLGTVVNRRTALFEIILEAMREANVRLLVTVGTDIDPDQFGPLPSHIHVTRYIPHTQIIPLVDLIICHAGFGTVMAALECGKPLVLLPFGADQPTNAQMCAAQGAGCLIDMKGMTSGTLLSAVDEVINNPIYKKNAIRIQTELEALPGTAEAVEMIERLA